MVIGLIGMAGVGKTRWSDKLTHAGYTCLHCDDLIATRLHEHFDVASGSLRDVGQWMGFPYEPQYAEREATYLAYESEILHDIAATLTPDTVANEKLVIDMTGSAIYVDPAILTVIRKVTTIVYLAVSPSQRQRMLETYLAQPRPVLWHGLYQPHPNEAPAAALARCYTDLLTVRSSLYAQLCDVQIDETVHWQDTFTVDDFLHLVEATGKPASATEK